MTDRDQIIAWARECTAPEWWDEPATGWHMGMDLARFASLVAAHEREQCARVCEAMGWVDGDGTAMEFADAIRGRAEK